jgi:hypothetical protein
VVFHWYSFSFTRTVEFNVDPLQHRVQIAADLRIPEPHNAMTLLLKPGLPLMISPRSFIVIVMTAIKFDDEPLGRTEEVDNVRTDRRA